MRSIAMKRNKDMPEIILLCLLGIGTCVVGSFTAIEIVEGDTCYETFQMFMLTVITGITFGSYSSYVYLRMMNGWTEDGQKDENTDS